MKAAVTVRNLKCKEGKRKIQRNLSRILNIRIVDINVDNGMLFFIYPDAAAFKKVKQELFRIGFPMQSSNYPKVSPPEIYGGGRTSGIAAV